MTDSASAGGDSTILSRNVLPWRALTVANGRITFRGSAVQLAGLTLHGVDFDATLRDGVLSFESFRGKLGKGALDGNATIAAVGNGGRIAFALDAPRLPLNPLVEQVDVVRAFNGAAALRVRLSGAGDSVAGILGQLSGKIDIRVGPGKMAIELPGTGRRALAVGPAAIFGMLVPKTASETDIRCAAIRLAVRKGVLHSVGSVAESAVAIVVADGNIDFAQERFNTRFSPRSKGPALWVAMPVQIAGALTAPKFGVVPGADSVSYGGPFSPLTSFFDRLLNSTDGACNESKRVPGRTRIEQRPGQSQAE